jgi:hypothetical protein
MGSRLLPAPRSLSRLFFKHLLKRYLPVAELTLVALAQPAQPVFSLRERDRGMILLTKEVCKGLKLQGLFGTGAWPNNTKVLT